MTNIASRPAGFLSRSTGGAARCYNGFNDGAAFARTAEWVSVFPSDESTAAGPSGSSELGLYAGGGVQLSTPSTPRSPCGEASRSPGAELSARSAFASTPDQAPCSNGTQAFQHSKEKSGAHSFLRKGSRMARSQPPANAGRVPGGAQPKRLQLQPRDAFKQAAVLVAERSAMQATPLHARSSQASVGTPVESALRTPRRSSGRRVCSLTPDGKSAAAGHSSCLTDRACVSVEVADANSCRGASGSCLGPPRDKIPSAHCLSADAAEDSRCEADRQLQALDSHLEQFQRENEALQQLQEQTELAERELALEREEIRSEMEVERKALRSEVVAERETLQQARRQFNAEMEQQRLAAASERLKFRQRTDQMQEELDAKQKHWQRRVDRLQQEVKELSRTNRSLQDQLIRARQLAIEGPTNLGKECHCPPVRRWAVSPARRTQAPLVSDVRRSTGGKAASHADSTAGLSASTRVEDVPPSPELPVQVLQTHQPRGQGQGDPATGALSSLDHSMEMAEALAATMPGPPEAPPLPAFVPPLRCAHLEVQLAGELLPHQHEADSFEGKPRAGHAVGISMGGSCCSTVSVDGAAFGRWQGHQSLRAGARFASLGCPAEAAAAEAAAAETAAAKAAAAEAAAAEAAAAEAAAAGVEACEDRAELLRESRTSEGRIERLFADGRREVLFPNGLRKVVRPDGQASVLFQNGDVKETLPDGSVRYHYSTTRTVQTTHPDGTNVYWFASGQIERHYLDGSKEISFPNGTTKTVASDGSEDVRFADGTRRFVAR